MKRFRHPGWLVLLGAIGYAIYMYVRLSHTYFSAKNDTDRIRHIVASEELMLELNKQLRDLSQSAENLRLPNVSSQEMFAETMRVADITDDRGNVLKANTNVQVAIYRWSIGDVHDIQAQQLDLWQPMLEDVAYFDHARFYFIDAKFIDASLTDFESQVGFQGLAKLANGRWAGIKSKQKIVWQKQKAGSWKIREWVSKEFKTIESPKLLFVDVLDQALPNPSDLERARNSAYDQAVRQFYRGGGQSHPWKYFTPISANQRPGISVVDIDRDGFDDLYIMVRRGKNQLLRNQQNGTFKEEAARWGLDIEHFSSCGIFADFDNDGDPDLMLGRSVERSMYLENTGDRFLEKQVSDQADTLPFLVVSMSAVDYNLDGLLDVYLSTYRPAVLESIVSDESSEHENESDNATGGTHAISEIASHSQRWTDEFLPPAQAQEYAKRLEAKQDSNDHYSQILNQVGPPNVLLINRGNGRFDVAPESPQLAVWRNTLQATWADIDDDGDSDLYVANDWAIDNLFVNNGRGQFTEVTEELGTTEFGFGMGVSWGDYDQDGYQDIYVSNMYSKAGRRITAQISELDPSYNRSVDGNFLYRGSSEGFQLVSGLEPPALTVAEAGWSWGGQFADFDNDGRLDIYVLSGYFTAPEEFASDVDL